MTHEGTLQSDSQAKAKVFISYSRKDMAFVDRLERALEARGFKPLIDRAEIYAFEDWWRRIETLVSQADTIVFTLSPDSVSSDVCRKEIAFAATLNKRLAPIVCHRVDEKLVPPELARLNFIFFDDETHFEDSATRLADALETNIDWIRRHTEFGEEARRWAAAGRSKAGGLLLRSPLLEEAELWIASRPPGAPPPTETTQAFITESRRGATRRRNILTGSLAAGLVLALGLAGLAYWQRGVANAQRTLAVRNFDAAKSTINSVIFDLAQGLRDVEGIRADTVRVILGRADNAIGQLASETQNDPEVRRLQEVMYNLFSDTYLRLGATETAVENSRKALAIARSVVAKEPDNAEWQHDLSVALERLGDALRAAGDRAGALAAYRESLDIRRAVIAKNPNDTTWQHGLSVALQNVGQLEQQQGNETGALAAYRESRDNMRALVAKNPGNAEWQRDLSLALNMIGDVLSFQGDFKGALASYQEALDIGRALVAKDAGNMEWQRDVSLDLNNVGDALLSTGDRPGALAAAREALDIARAIAAKDPDNTQWQRDLSISLNKVGGLLLNQNDPAGALDTFRQGLDIRRKLAAKDPGNAQWQLDLLASLERVADVLAAQSNTAEALKDYREALDIARVRVAKDPDGLQGQIELVYVLSKAGPLTDPAEGRAMLNEALAILKKLERDHKLPAAQKNWPAIVRDRLSKLP